MRNWLSPLAGGLQILATPGLYLYGEYLILSAQPDESWVWLIPAVAWGLLSLWGGIALAVWLITRPLDQWTS